MQSTLKFILFCLLALSTADMVFAQESAVSAPMKPGERSLESILLRLGFKHHIYFAIELSWTAAELAQTHKILLEMKSALENPEGKIQALDDQLTPALAAKCLLSRCPVKPISDALQAEEFPKALEASFPSIRVLPGNGVYYLIDKSLDGLDGWFMSQKVDETFRGNPGQFVSNRANFQQDETCDWASIDRRYFFPARLKHEEIRVSGKGRSFRESLFASLPLSQCDRIVWIAMRNSNSGRRSFLWIRGVDHSSIDLDRSATEFLEAGRKIDLRASIIREAIKVVDDPAAKREERIRAIRILSVYRAREAIDALVRCLSVKCFDSDILEEAHPALEALISVGTESLDPVVNAYLNADENAPFYLDMSACLIRNVLPPHISTFYLQNHPLESSNKEKFRKLLSKFDAQKVEE